MTTATRPAPHHRSLYCVKQFNCHRPECLDRSRAYTRNRYQRVGYGTWQPLVDANPARQHVETLRTEGASTTAIAEAANVSTATLARIIYGQPAGRPTEKIRRESAEALLAVSIDQCRVAPGTAIDGTGTRRRLQALVAMGWPFTALSPHIGLHSRQLGSLARAERVTAGTATKVQAAYRQLSTWAPEQYGVKSQGQALARRVARREGWAPPGAWDDIDDPQCRPDLGPADTLNRNELAVYRREEIRRLDRFGVSEHDIAARLGMATAYVHDLIREIHDDAAAA